MNQILVSIKRVEKILPSYFSGDKISVERVLSLCSPSGPPGQDPAQSAEPRQGRRAEAAPQPPRGLSEEPGEAPGGEAGGRDHQAGEGTSTDLLLGQGGHPVSRGGLSGGACHGGVRHVMSW